MAFGRKTPPVEWANVYHCVVCNRKINPNSKSTAQRVGGWITPRSGGGANHIKYKETYPAYAHEACLEELHSPVTANQDALFKDM